MGSGRGRDGTIQFVARNRLFSSARLIRKPGLGTAYVVWNTQSRIEDTKKKRAEREETTTQSTKQAMLDSWFNGARNLPQHAHEANISRISINISGTNHTSRAAHTFTLYSKFVMTATSVDFDIEPSMLSAGLWENPFLFRSRTLWFSIESVGAPHRAALMLAMESLKSAERVRCAIRPRLYPHLAVGPSESRLRTEGPVTDPSVWIHGSLCPFVGSSLPLFSGYQTRHFACYSEGRDCLYWPFSLPSLVSFQNTMLRRCHAKWIGYAGTSVRSPRSITASGNTMVQTLGHFSPAAPYGPDGAYWGLTQVRGSTNNSGKGMLMVPIVSQPYHGQIGGLLFTR
ncbi:uncharacterized protein CLUP02_08442 [Colletotrichum lupini]|uniref:Uncharacterized protein n=1 Tax=Colletotrichum lupini TaxID=145971 RepID=A0A9Q8SUS0_9PEZI|nr:uncharacterized protein CLUP02_08442 [Colletotrichum lupini]UQC82952.1 hypothetical protein CLUP02_08442 [Colletotrichum lupini]